MLPDQIPELRISIQGGVGTYEEHRTLINNCGVDSVGWRIPFLLVPEVTQVDFATLDQLRLSNDEQVWLSNSSPLGMPFWNLKNSSSERVRRTRIVENRPGSPCLLGFAATERSQDGIPWCKASRAYQVHALAELENKSLSDQERAKAREEIVAKSCICCELGGGARKRMNGPNSYRAAICPGPNIVNFGQVMALEELVGHIYGRVKLSLPRDRKNMFIRELELYIEFLEKNVSPDSADSKSFPRGFIRGAVENIQDGIEFYRRNALGVVGSNRGASAHDTLNLNRLAKRNDGLCEWIRQSDKANLAESNGMVVREH